MLFVARSGTFLLDGDQLLAQVVTRTPLAAEDRKCLVLEVAAAALHIVAWHADRGRGEGTPEPAVVTPR